MTAQRHERTGARSAPSAAPKTCKATEGVAARLVVPILPRAGLHRFPLGPELQYCEQEDRHAPENDPEPEHELPLSSAHPRQTSSTRPESHDMRSLTSCGGHRISD